MLTYPEPHVVFAILAPFASFTPLSTSLLRTYCHECYLICRLLNGPIEAMLSNDPTAATVRSGIGAVLSDILAKERPEHPLHVGLKLRNPLGRVLGCGWAGGNFRTVYAF